MQLAIRPALTVDSLCMARSPHIIATLPSELITSPSSFDAASMSAPISGPKYGPLPLLIGVTGHRNLRPEDTAEFEKRAAERKDVNRFNNRRVFSAMAKLLETAKNKLLFDVDAVAKQLTQPSGDKPVPPEQVPLAGILRERRISFIQDESKSPSPITEIYFHNANALPDPSQVLPEVGKLKSLTVLFLTNQPVQDADLKPLVDLQQLKHLSLNGTKVTDAGIPHLKELKSVEQISVRGLPLTNAGLTTLAGLPALKHIYDVGLQVSDEAIAKLRKEKKIRILR